MSSELTLQPQTFSHTFKRTDTAIAVRRSKPRIGTGRAAIDMEHYKAISALKHWALKKARRLAKPYGVVASVPVIEIEYEPSLRETLIHVGFDWAPLPAEYYPADYVMLVENQIPSYAIG